MTGKVTRLFDRNRDRVWRPAPDRQTIRQPELSILDQLDQFDLAEQTSQLPPQDRPAAPRPMPAVDAANERQRLRHANELLRTFTKTA